MRYSITLSYDGHDFFGWQSQPEAVTVQESLEKALSTLLGEETAVTGAGRTDSKVNAVGYIAHFDSGKPFDAATLGYKLNAILPRGIVVHGVSPVSEDFHARFCASRREYTYFLHRMKDPFAENYSWHCSFPLDLEAMNRAARCLVGRHDFSCFEKKGADNKTSICTVTEAFWAPYTPTHVAIMGYMPAAPKPGTEAPEATHIYFRIAADRFLRNMVRAIVGSLVEVGRGKKTVEEFEALVLPVTEDSLQGIRSTVKTRSDAGESAPGHALFLSSVEY